MTIEKLIFILMQIKEMHGDMNVVYDSGHCMVDVNCVATLTKNDGKFDCALSYRDWDELQKVLGIDDAKVNFKCIH